MFESRRVPVVAPLSIKISPARRAFKEMLGQNNHFLITIMIGLDAVAKGEARLSEEFSTTWAPRDVEQSARRSREFACKALTAWLSDSIAAYIRNLSVAPTIITDPGLASTIMTAESLGERINDIAVVCSSATNIETLLTRTAVIWRNRLVHYQARNKVDHALASALLSYRQEIASDYRGLDIERLLGSIGKSHAPTHKEIASLVQAAHRFVQRIDGQLLAKSDLDKYVMNVLSYYISSDPIQRTSNIWGKDQYRRLTSIVQVCKQYSMTDQDRETRNQTSESLLQEIAEWTPAQARVNLSDYMDS